jgi:hypothetical protein|tara:strand:- start:256 stop:543 length:288 start_codon:yes stop_codon:yes gene_type:complete
MASIINHYIDLTKVDKSRLKDGKILQITTVVDDTTKYGNNVGTYESMSKDEKDAGKKRNYVGNGKVVWTDGSITVAEKENSTKKAATPATEDLPF